MDIQFRVVLLVVGVLILLGVAIDFFRRRPGKRASNLNFSAQNNQYENELLNSTSPLKANAQQATFIDDYELNPEYDAENVEPVIEPMGYEVRNFTQDDDTRGYDFATEPAAGFAPTADFMPSANFNNFSPSSNYSPNTHSSTEQYKPAPPPATPEIIAIHIMSRTPTGFKGAQLYNALRNAHLYIDTNNIFNRHENEDGTGSILFSVLKAVEPGYFDIEMIQKEQVPGITLLLIPSKVENPENALDKLVRAAKQIAFALNGELLDHERQALTSTTIENYKTKVINNS